MASLNDWQDPVFPEQQAQIIYKQFLLGREQLKEILIEQLKEHNELLDIPQDEILDRISVESLRVSSDSGCDTDNDEERLLSCDLHVNNTVRTIMNILSIVNTLEAKHRENVVENCSNLEQAESVESEDEVFSSPLNTPSEVESMESSVSQ